MIVLINYVGTLPVETYWSLLLETDQFEYGTPEVIFFIINAHLNNLKSFFRYFNELINVSCKVCLDLLNVKVAII